MQDDKANESYSGELIPSYSDRFLLLTTSQQGSHVYHGAAVLGLGGGKPKTIACAPSPVTKMIPCSNENILFECNTPASAHATGPCFSQGPAAPHSYVAR